VVRLPPSETFFGEQNGPAWRHHPIRPRIASRRHPSRAANCRRAARELRARVAKTVAFVKSLDAKKIDGSIDREITFPLGPNNKGHVRGIDYLNHFALPNFYFHLTTAYDILRHNGVEIGKRDFLGAIPMRMT
jgi:hypothetical protein